MLSNDLPQSVPGEPVRPRELQDRVEIWSALEILGGHFVDMDGH